MNSLLEDWRNVKHTCTKCNSIYTELNNWNKACRVHLGKKILRRDTMSVWGIGHWDCCGASWLPCDKHYEWKIPYGCYYMDHTVLYEPYSTSDNNFLSLVPIEFESLMKTPITKQNIVATIFNEKQEHEYIQYMDDSFRNITIKPINLVQRELGRKQRSLDYEKEREQEEFQDEDNAETFYDDIPTFVPYYIVKRVITEYQDQDRVKYFKDKGEHKWSNR